jgi:UDP-glucuronate 4-epimerase
MAILVTGGAGFIGSHVCEALLSRREDVVCLDNFDDFYSPSIKRRNLEPSLSRPGFSLEEGDIRDAERLEQVFARYSIGAVIHLAARAGVRPSIREPALYADVNVTGTVRVLEAARRAGVSRFVFASSSSVYGARTGLPFKESDVVDAPASPYAATKRAGELLCGTEHRLSGMPITCLRFFTVYGPRQRPEMAIHKFTSLIDRGEPVPLFGDGRSARDYTYVDDIVAGVLGALDACAGFAVYNLGNSDPIGLDALVCAIEAALGKKARRAPSPPEPGDVPFTCADVSAARTAFGYAPAVNLAEGIQRFAAWYRREASAAP